MDWIFSWIKGSNSYYLFNFIVDCNNNEEGEKMKYTVEWFAGENKDYVIKMPYWLRKWITFLIVGMVFITALLWAFS